MIQVCAICDRIYGEKEPYEDKSYTHGYCPECYKKEMIRLKKQMVEMGMQVEENPKDSFLKSHEVEIEQYPEGWNAYRFGLLIARGFHSRAALVSYLKRYFEERRHFPLPKNPRRRREKLRIGDTARAFLSSGIVFEGTIVRFPGDGTVWIENAHGVLRAFPPTQVTVVYTRWK